VTRFFIALSLAACTGQDDVLGPTTGETTSTTTGTTTGTTPATVANDEALLRQAIAGKADAAQTLSTIADQDGFPVQTSTGTFLFACLCGDGDWSLAGDHDGWAGTSLSRQGDLWWADVDIPSPDGSLYKFVDSIDNTDATWIADPLARRYGYDDYGEYSLVRATAAHLERWLDVGGQGLDPRELRVWLPDGGSFTHALYAQDGQNLFDPSASWGGWRLQDSLPDDVMVVGIDNTAARMDEYTHTTDQLDGVTYGGLGDAYADLLTDIIRPKIEAAYGTADVNGVMGSSLGGLISATIGYRHPESWDMVISMSGTMGWGSIELHNQTMPELWQAAGHGDVPIYIDSGGSGDCYDSDGDGVPDDDPTASDNYCENAWMAELLAGVGYEWDIDLWHWHEPGAEHNEAAWADRVWRPLDLFASL